MPWSGTHKGPQALPDVFVWKTLDFKVIDTIEQGNRVAFFGSFTYKSIATGKEITSPFSLVGAFRGGKGRLRPVSRGQLWHRRLVKKRRRHTVSQRSAGKRGSGLTLSRFVMFIACTMLKKDPFMKATSSELLMRNFNEIFIELDPLTATCRWGSGMPGQPMHTGTDFLEERDGRVSRLYTFIDQKLFQS
jgi:hypothetical protein